MNYDNWKTTEPEEKQYECYVCGKPLNSDSGICASRACFEADNM